MYRKEKPVCNILTIVDSHINDDTIIQELNSKFHIEELHCNVILLQTAFRNPYPYVCITRTRYKLATSNSWFEKLKNLVGNAVNPMIKIGECLITVQQIASIIFWVLNSLSANS